MKILKSIGNLIIIVSGVYVSYLAFLEYNLENWTQTGIFVITALSLLCFGIVSLLLTLTKKSKIQNIDPVSIPVEEPMIFDDLPTVVEELFKREDVDEIETPVALSQPVETGFTEETNSDEAAELDDLSLSANDSSEESDLEEGMSEVQEYVPSEINDENIQESAIEEFDDSLTKIEPIEIANPIEKPEEVVEPIRAIILPSSNQSFKPIDIKEDPQFLFGDWWVDEDGLYIDMRLIGIAGRKPQKTLRKIELNTKLDYHINSKSDTIEIVYNKVVIGLVPELYLHSLKMYIQGVEHISAQSMIKKGRDVMQFMVRVRFNDDLREKLQKKLQQKTWQ